MVGTVDSMRHPMVPRLAVLPVALLGLALSACGADSAASATTVPDGGSIAVTMTDIAFDTDAVQVPAGATVEFRFTNDGKVPHDAFVGDEAAQQEHEAEMAGMPAGHAHDMGTEGVTVQPGETEVLTYTFEQPGEVQIGCHQKGHYAAGMHLSVLVD